MRLVTIAVASSVAAAALAEARLREAGFDVLSADGPDFREAAADELRRERLNPLRNIPVLTEPAPVRAERGAQWKRERQGRGRR